MEILQYPAEELHHLIDVLRSKRITGLIYVDAIVNPQQQPKSYVLALQSGDIVYGGFKMPTNEEFAQALGTKFNHSMTDAAIQYATRKMKNPSSFRELLDFIVKIRMLTWQQIEATVHAQVVQVLEQILPYPGQLQLDMTVGCDLSYGKDHHSLNWSLLMRDVVSRQHEWATFESTIPSTYLTSRLEPKLRDRLQQWLEQQRPIILTIDDSQIVQVAIKRILGDRYQVILADNAADALLAINTNPIRLILLDVMMPDIDGLEFCRTVRSMEHFQELPIIMLTARDKFSDKLKGKIAGATHYLTKPFVPQQLLKIVEACVTGDKNFAVN